MKKPKLMMPKNNNYPAMVFQTQYQYKSIVYYYMSKH